MAWAVVRAVVGSRWMWGEGVAGMWSRAGRKVVGLPRRLLRQRLGGGWVGVVVGVGCGRWVVVGDGGRGGIGCGSHRSRVGRGSLGGRQRIVVVRGERI